jgi:hypothetical protein
VGSQGENAPRNMTKGRGVAIDGRLGWREYEAGDGSRRRRREHRGRRAVLARPDLTASEELHAPTPAPSMTADDNIPFWSAGGLFACGLDCVSHRSGCLSNRGVRGDNRRQAVAGSPRG